MKIHSPDQNRITHDSVWYEGCLSNMIGQCVESPITVILSEVPLICVMFAEEIGHEPLQHYRVV